MELPMFVASSFIILLCVSYTTSGDEGNDIEMEPICIEDTFLNDSNTSETKQFLFVCKNKSMTIELKPNKTDQSNLVQSIRSVQLKKCCNSTSSGLKLGFNTCIETNISSEWNPPIHSKEKNITSILNINHFHAIEELLQCQTNFVAQSTSEFFLYEDGVMELASSGHKFQPGEFCVNNVPEQGQQNKSDYVTRYCIANPCQNKTCVRKCCPFGFGFRYATTSCESYNESFIPEFRNERNQSVAVPDNNYSVLPGFPDCDPILLNRNDNEKFAFSLNPSGDLHVPGSIENPFIKEYCIDRFLDDLDLKAFICHNTQDESTIYPYFFFLSAIFSLLTFIAYCLLRELRNLHGITLMCYIMSFAISCIVLGILQINKFPLGLCIPFAIILHYSFLCSFTWLNVLCFDIWWTLSGIRIRVINSEHRSVGLSRRFLSYSCYAWGLPFLIVIIGQILDSVGEPNDSIIRPAFGKMRCWFSDENSKLLYFYGPVGIILAGNLIFFILTAINLYKTSRDTSIARQNTKSNHRVPIIFGLFILMGVTWITEIFSWAIGGPIYYWIATDIVNILTGVYIFILFVCKKKVIKLLSKKLGWKKRIACSRCCLDDPVSEEPFTDSSNKPQSSTVPRGYGTSNASEETMVSVIVSDEIRSPSNMSEVKL